eukprot:TRINITY_DN2325_c0_g5_i1.p1 TRINITY_DN2325_c0_g5~~TRINITY_DN2325_c0_g5_i1.p1  ORF type:complete len:972 (+),score=319.49 TRINITY_DN2325_c0_g5_i1:142-3057(+)
MALGRALSFPAGAGDGRSSVELGHRDSGVSAADGFDKGGKEHENFLQGEKKGSAVSSKKALAPHTLCARAIVDNKYFTALTTILTIWALTGDDLRILFTSQPADIYFDLLVVLMILVFSVEVVLSVLGKADYYMSFFYWLDIVSTVTLVLDLTFVNDLILGGGGDDEGSSGEQLKQGRTARFGAKMGRVVRVLRLVRILKLYKAYYESRARKKQQEAEKAQGDHDDDWDEADLEEKEDKEPSGKESRVGKKLSEMTTRRVIFLIIGTMLADNLLPMPMNLTGAKNTSVDYGVITVSQSLKAAVSASSAVAFEGYQQSLFKLLLYHQLWPFDCPTAKKDDGRCLPSSNLGAVFWVGIDGEEEATVLDMASKAKADATFVDEHLKTVAKTYHMAYPESQIPALSQSWSTVCDQGKKWKRGISLIGKEAAAGDPDLVGYQVDCPWQLRSTEYEMFYSDLETTEEMDKWRFIVYTDVRQFTKEQAAFNLGQTLFVCVALCLAALLFSNDANALVLNPVENMIRRVESIRDNPLIALQMADDEFKAEEVAKARLKRMTPKERAQKVVMDILCCKGCGGSNSSEPMETMILEKTIIKLGSLLALGFGEAGTNIIGANMKGSASAGVNAMIPGVRVDCIIGFARVKNFSTATEVLQKNIMKFVNQIAEIVHGVVNEHWGAANKNHGETFLIIWQQQQVQGTDEQQRELQKSKQAELSVIAFARILLGVHRSPILATYRGHPGLQLRLGSGCRVHMSFGLHCGWAIEGAVGSEFKIDASYLSPNVSIARQVENSADQYGVPIVVAQSVKDICSKTLTSYFRLMDNVIITGSQHPMELYTFDLDFMAIPVANDDPLKLVWSTRQRFKARQFLDQEKHKKMGKEFCVASDFAEDPFFHTMRKIYTTEFMQLFNSGFQNYIQGEWQVARRMLSVSQEMLGVEDGPSSALLRFMEAPHQFEAPRTWSGVRELNPALRETAPKA